MKRYVMMVLLSSLVIGGLILASGAVVRAFPRPSSSSGTSSRSGSAQWSMMGSWQRSASNPRPSDSSGAPSPSGYSGWSMMGSYGSNGMMGSWQESTASARALTINQAQHRVQLYIKQYANPHLVIDEIMEFQRNFYAIVKDRSTSHGAFEVLVNKWTGLVFPEYGLAMMWNTRYGMMRGGMMGYRYPSGPMTVSPAQAARIARQWLGRYRPGTTIETPDQFPGYYTVHFRKNGTIAGMLSVNGYSGQGWYHSWHGTFIRMKTVDG